MPTADDLGHFLEEEGHQQGGDVGAIDIGVGHDDHAVVAQIVRVAVLAKAAAQSEGEVGDFAVGADFVGCSAGHIEDFAANGEDRLRLAIPRLLGAAACPIALDDEQFGLAFAFAGAIGELAGQAELAGAGGGFALDLALGFAGEALVHPLEDMAEQRLAALHIVGEEMVEMVANRVFDQARGFGQVRRSLVWLWNCGSRMKTESMDSLPVITSSGVMSLAFFWPTRSAKARMPLISAARSPASWVPPSGVGMVLQYQL